MVVSVRFDAEMGDYESGIADAIQAIRDWESQTGVSALNTSEKFEDAIRGVVELGKATGRSKDDMVRALEGLRLPADDAKEAIEAIEREAESLGRSAPSEVRPAGDAVARIGDAADDAKTRTSKIKEGAETAGGGLRNLGQIATDVLQGDFGSAAQGALDGFGAMALDQRLRSDGLAAGDGLGVAAGVGGAVGGVVADALGGLVGAMISQLQEASKQAEKTKQDILQSFIELGDGLDQAAVETRFKAILADPDTRRQAELLRDLMGVDLSQAALAMAGEFEAAGVKVEDVAKAINDAPGTVNTEDWDALKRNFEAVNGALEEGPELANQAADGLTRVAVKAAEAAVAAGDATKAVDDLGQTVYLMPDGKVVVIDAETGQARQDIKDIDDYKLDVKKQGVEVDDDAAMNDLLNVQNYTLPGKTVPLKVTVDTSAWDNWRPGTKSALARVRIDQAV